MPNLSVISVEDFLALAATNIRQMSDQFVNVIISLALVIGFIVVLLAMYTAILERTREIGILKALGASKTYIVGVVMRETVVICLFGILLGYGLSFLGRAAVAARFPLVPGDSAARMDGLGGIAGGRRFRDRGAVPGVESGGSGSDRGAGL